MHAFQLEQAVLGMQRYLAAGKHELASQLLQSAVQQVETFDLSGKIIAQAMQNDATDAVEIRRAGRLN